MRSPASEAIFGNWATLLLPITDSDQIDYDLLTGEIDRFIAAGVNGIYSNGTAGEFHTQTETEFDQINMLLAEKCRRAQQPFQIGASHTNAHIARERVRRAKALQPTAFQVILPDWYPVSPPETLAFLETMAAEADPIPLVVYNPPHAKRRIEPAEWLTLAERVPGIAGIKVLGGDDAWYEAMQPVMARWSVFIPGHLLAAGLAGGARGAYSNVACLNPLGAQRWYELCRRDPAASLRQQESIQAFWKNNVSPLITKHGLSPMAADKSAACAGGWLPGLSPRLRWPYHGADEAMIRQIAEAAKREVPELLVEIAKG